MDVEPLVAVHYVPVCLRIRPGAEQHLLVHFRCGGIEHPASRSIERDVGTCVVSDIIHYARHIL